MFRSALVAGFAWALACSIAQAVPVEIDFSGGFQPCSVCTGTPGPYTGRFSFDTTQGTFAQFPDHYEFNGVVSGTISGLLSLMAIGEVFWSDTNPSAFFGATPGGFDQIYAPWGSGGFVQYGTCPSHCGFLSVESVTVHDEALHPAPGPVAGSGWAALLISLLLWRNARGRGAAFLTRKVQEHRRVVITRVRQHIAFQ